jgi:hypothetical protein
LAAPGLIEASVDGHTLPLEELNAGTTVEKDAADDLPARMRVTLLEKRIGAFELMLKYPLADRQPSSDMVQIKVPLVMPGEGECHGNELTVIGPGETEVQGLDPSWSSVPADDTDLATGEGLRLVSPTPLGEVLLGLRLDKPSTPEPTVVERVWLQTCFESGVRRDRAVFAFSSRQNRLTVRLPKGLGILSPSFELDGRTVTDSGPSFDERVISLPKAGLHVLEVSYRVDLSSWRGFVGEGLSRQGGRWTIEVPQIEGTSESSPVEVRETFWQLVLPGDEYLLAWPAALSPETIWTMAGFYWGRRPTWEQADLETWSGLTEHSTPLAGGTNRYLFSTAQIDAPLVVRTAGRSSLVLAISGLVLGCGLAWIYLPVLRHPAVLLVASITVLAAAAVAPELTVIGLQASVLGIALTLFAGMLKRGNSSHGSRAALRGASSSIVGRGSTKSHPRVAVAVTPTSTETAAVAVELSAPQAGA